jgi:hypothetical protein
MGGDFKGSFVKKLKAWGGLQSNDMNIDWTPKRQSKKPFNNRQLKKKIEMGPIPQPSASPMLASIFNLNTKDPF